MKFSQVIEHMRIFVFKNHAKNEARRLVPNLFLVFKKDSYEAKVSCIKI